jgi:hypothetical protein
MRSIRLTRDEAEHLTDVLLGHDDPVTVEIDAEVREVFGMVSRQQEVLDRARIKKFLTPGHYEL